MAGGSQILINAQGITITTPSKISYKAAQHKFGSGQRVTAELPNLPHPEQTHNLQYIVKNKEGKALKKVPYMLIAPDNSFVNSVTSSKGEMTLLSSKASEHHHGYSSTGSLLEAEDGQHD